MAAGSGRISVLVSKELQTLLSVTLGLDKAVAARVRAETKKVAERAWSEELGSRVTTRLQSRALAETARVSVSNANVVVKSATVGKLSSGTPVSVVAGGAEFGGSPGRVIEQRSSRGKRYRRTMGPAFSPVRRGGYAVFESVRESAARLASLWIQTTKRTVAEEFEKGAR